MAFACMDVLRFELGLSVPHDVSVVGFDDVLLASWPTYNLTTVSQPVERMADHAVDMLVHQINVSKTSGQRIAIDGNLVVRSSTADRSLTLNSEIRKRKAAQSWSVTLPTLPISFDPDGG
jgi:DNA-binding LacI/PurR family transcriptional regulator